METGSDRLQGSLLACLMKTSQTKGTLKLLAACPPLECKSLCSASGPYLPILESGLSSKADLPGLLHSDFQGLSNASNDENAFGIPQF